MKLKNIIVSWDLVSAIIITVIMAYFFTYIDYVDFRKISIKFAETGVAIFSVIFPLFFAALTIIITASDDDFAIFLQERGYLNPIIASFKFTLLLIFITFLYSIALHVFIEYLFSFANKNTTYILISFYFSLFLYALFSTFNSILDSMNYARYRGEYFSRKKK